MKAKEIERSILTNYRKSIFRPFTKAITDYNLLEDGDKIAVCISGGKDSLVMAKCMQEIERHGKKRIKCVFMVMNPGYNDENLKKIIESTKEIGIDVTVVDSQIFAAVKNANHKSPCYICAKMRRGFLYNAAQELGCNKIALGHHFDDVIETTFLSMLYNGIFNTMLPMLNSQNFPGMKLIRPLFYVKEQDIKAWVKYNELFFIDCACKVTKKDLGKRLEIKKLTEELVKMYKNADINIFNSMFNVNKNTTKYIDE